MLYIGIPAHNEATTLGVLLWRLRSVLADVSREYEVVVYDDASTDDTTETLAPYTRVLPLTVLRGPRQVGYAGAVDAIVRHVARTTRYPRRDALLLLQGDFTDPPALVPEFLKRFEGGADLVIGERISAGDAPTAVRRLWTAARWVLRPFVGISHVRDLTTSYRLVRIAVLRDLIRNAGDGPVAAGDGWAANADFLLRAAELARRVETIPFTPTFGVRTRDTRRTAWPDALALARWGWRRRGTRIAVKIVSRPAEADSEDAPAGESLERSGAAERRERTERGERRPRRDAPARDAQGREGREDGARGRRRDRAEAGERSGREKPRREKARPEKAADGRDPASEGGDGAERERRSRRKRGTRRERVAGERAVDETATAGGEAPALPVNGEPPLPRGVAPEPSVALSAPDDDTAAPRRKRSRRGRRRKGSAEGGGDEQGAAPEGAEDGGESGVEGAAGGDEGSGDEAARRRRRSRRGRRGGSRRRGEAGGEQGAGEPPPPPAAED